MELSYSYRYKSHVVHRLASRVARDLPHSDTHRPCETVHLAIIVEDVPSAINLVKSILIYRHSSLQLYLIAEPFTQDILETFLSTWGLPYFNFTFYSHQSLKSKLSWMPDMKLKDVPDLIKLLLPTIVPNDVNRLIIIDGNVTFLSDIRLLHEYFWDMQEENNMFASVGKHSNIATTQVVEDTGVLLMDVGTMRERNWFHLWHKVVYDEVKNSKRTYSFTLRSILEMITKMYPKSHVTLPCYWNIHYATRNTCTPNTTDIKLIHWDSVPEEKLFKDELTNYLLVYDGKALRKKPWICYQPFHFIRRSRRHRKVYHQPKPNQVDPNLPKSSRREMCRILKKESEQVFRTHRYYYGSVYQPITDFETTMVTQLSLDRLDKFQLLLEHWNGPISIAMYGTDAQAWNLTIFLQKKGLTRKNLAIHIVYRQGKFYPVNHLRNIALNAVTTPYVFLNDGDFLPSYGLFDYLKSMNKYLMSDSKKRALVIPAFDGRPGFSYPENKANLLDQLSNNSIRMFCVWCAHQTHGPTNYSLWAETNYPYKVEWAFHFEPYVVVRSDVVRYDERFVGYGWNKVSQITELKAQGYEFVVVPNGFVIHSPHKKSADREVWKRKNFKFCINTLWKRFIQGLTKKYGSKCLNEEKLPPSIIKIPIS